MISMILCGMLLVQVLSAVSADDTTAGSCLIQKLANVEQVEVSEDTSSRMEEDRQELVKGIARHWINAVAEDVTPHGADVSCSHLPKEAMEVFDEENKHGQVCREDGRVPSERDLEFYMRFLESPCVNAEGFLNPQHLVSCVFKTAPKAPGAIDAYDNFNWDKLAAFEQKYQSKLQELAPLCRRVLHEGGACDYDMASLVEQTGKTQRAEEVVSQMRWLIAPVRNPIAESVGHLHSFLELTASGGKFIVEVFPREVGVSVGARRATRSDEGAQVHASATSEMLKPNLSVSQMVEIMRRHENGKYHVIHNNCHKIIQSAFRWGAPTAGVPESPNSNWEAVAAKIDAVSPEVTALMLEMSGASRSLCAGGNDAVRK
jgi:hypothetical protein